MAVSNIRDFKPGVPVSFRYTNKLRIGVIVSVFDGYLHLHEFHNKDIFKHFKVSEGVFPDIVGGKAFYESKWKATKLSIKTFIINKITNMEKFTIQ